MAKKLAIIFGIVLVLVGLLGFVPNSVIGPNGSFVTDATLSCIYLIIGIILIIAGAMSSRSSMMWLKVFGVIYLILFIDGLFQPTNLLGFIMANGNTAWLHLIVGIILLIAGYSAKGGKMAMIDKATM